MTPVDLRPSTLGAGYGWHWIRGGFELFRRAPLVWIALVLVFLLILIVLPYLPIVGPMLFILLYPVFFAGFMRGCAALDAGQELDIAHLFSGFGNRAAALVTLGGMNLVAQIAIAGALVLTGGDHLINFERNGIDMNDPAATLAALQDLAVPLLLYLMLSLPIVMAMWFAPTLLAFHDVKPLAAAKASFLGCTANLAPFTVYGLGVFALLLLVTPAVGIASLILSPLIGVSAALQLVLSVVLGSPVLATILASNYSGYKDVFATASAVRALPGTA